MYLVAGVLLLFGSVITAETCTCGNWTIPTYLKLCEDTSNCSILFEIGECVTCNPTTCSTEWDICRLTLKLNSFIVFRKPSYYLVSACTCKELNDRVCGPFNREGLLCSKCKPGYGPAPYSWSLKCERCHDEYVGGSGYSIYC